MSIIMILLMVGMVGTLLVLLAGLVGMASGGEFNRKYSNKLMTARVALQGFTVVMLAVLFLAG